MTRKRWNWNGVFQEAGRQAEEERKARESGEEQLRLMKSLRDGGECMPGGGETKQVAVSSSAGKMPVCVAQVAERVVSLLAAPLSDEEFARQYGKPKHGFPHGGDSPEPYGKEWYPCLRVQDGNGFRAATVRRWDSAWSRCKAGEVVYPQHTILTGTAKSAVNA